MRQTFYLRPAIILSFLVKWMRDNMLELVETVTTEGGASSDEAVGDYLNRRKKYWIYCLDSVVHACLIVL